MATISCSTDDLVTQALCFERCIPPGMQMAVQTYLLAVIAGGSMDPGTLANAARCFERCIPRGEQAAVQNYLLCQIANA